MVLAVASIAWLWRTADFSLVLPLLEDAHPFALTLAVVLLGFSLMIKSLRWKSLLPSHPGISRREAYRIFHISVLLNNLLPFRLGDGARVVSPAVRRIATAQQALVVLVIERLLDALTLTCVAMIAVPLFLADARRPLGSLGLSLPDIEPGTLVLAAAALAALVVAVIIAEKHGAARSAAWRPRTWLLSLRRDVSLLVLMPRREMTIVGISTLLLWAGTFSLHYALFLALDVPRARVDPLVLAIVVTVATNLSMLVPATPANIGVFHAAAATPLLAAGYPAEVAVAYSVIVHAVNTIPPMVVGAACLGGPMILGRLLGGRPASSA